MCANLYYDANDHPMDSSGTPTNIDEPEVDLPTAATPNHPSTSPVWQGATNYRSGIRTTGSGSNKRYYEWDYEHGGDIEVYNNRGQHIGVMDPNTSEMIKPAVPGREIDL